MRKAKLLIAVLLFPIVLFCQTQIILGKLIDIDDGDTFTILTADHTQYKIRLNGIDCPEKGQDFGKKAKDYTYQFCAGKTVVAELLSKDKYSRNIANVTVNGINLNSSLVAKGLAWHYTKYSNDANLAKLEQEARAKGTNIWSLSNPMAPWIYRHRGELELLAPLQPSHVYICNSTGSKTYHNKMCSGLSRCSKGINQLSISEARARGKKEYNVSHS